MRQEERSLWNRGNEVGRGCTEAAWKAFKRIRLCLVSPRGARKTRHCHTASDSETNIIIDNRKLFYVWGVLSVAANIVLMRQLHLNCKDWKIKTLFHFRIPAGLLRSLSALLVQSTLTVYCFSFILYHAEAVFHEETLLFTHFPPQHCW